MNNNEIGFYNVAIVYSEGNKVNFKNCIFKAKNTEKIKKENIAQFPPEYPLKENAFWIIDEDTII